MGKLHELLAVEETVVSQAEKLISETNEKFTKHSEFFTGAVRTLHRLKDSPEDQAIERAARREKQLPTTVPDTLEYIFPFMEKALDLKLGKHLTNQKAVADIIVDGKVVMSNVPVDFLLDLEKLIPRYRTLFTTMPTLDPSRKWEVERKGVWKSEAPDTTQTEKITYPVVLSEATDKHPAQVKEASKDVVVGLFNEIHFSGSATTDQKADVLILCDKLLRAVKEARMRANATEIQSASTAPLVKLFSTIFK